MGDFDKDGDLDLYVGNLSGANKLFLNQIGSTNHWLHVNLVGTASNRSAIGARVRVVSGSLSQIREISGGSGYMSQNSLTAEFGLGSLILVDTLEIYWPSGNADTLTAVSVDTLIEIHEGGLICGDCNGDRITNIADIVCKINYLFLGASLPCPPEVVDHNGDGLVNVADVMAEINYLFLGVPLQCPLLK